MKYGMLFDFEEFDFGFKGKMMENCFG